MPFTRLFSSQARYGQQACPSPKPDSSIRDGQTQNHDALKPPTSNPQEETATTSRNPATNKFTVSTTEDGPTSATAALMSATTDPSCTRNASTQLPGFIGLSVTTSILSTALSVSSTASSIRDVGLPTGAPSTDANEPAPSQKAPDGLSHGATAAIVVGILLVLAAFSCTIWIVIQNKWNDERTRPPTLASYDADLPLRDWAGRDEYRHTGTTAQTGMAPHTRDGMTGYGGLNRELVPQYPANAYWGQSVAWG